jgi:addiction module HigA family antidote
MPKFKKIRPVHPGDVLRGDYLIPLGISVNKLALRLGVPATRMGEIVNGRRAITPDTALRLARFFDTTPRFWLNMQAEYELEIAKDKLAETIERTVQPLQQVAV